MKNFINNNWLITVVGGILASVFMLFLSQSKPRLIYTLNEPLDFLVPNGNSTSQSSVQQLIVTNAGSAAAKDIVIRFKHPVRNPIVKKYSQSDAVRTLPKELPTEIDYPALPPGTSFKVSFSPGNAAIDKDSLTINHSEGAAEEAASAAQPKPIDYFSRYIYFVLIVIYLWIIPSSFRKESVERWWKHPSINLSIEGLIKARKPWYVTPNEFKRLLPKAILKHLQDHSSTVSRVNEVQGSDAYSVLNVAPPNAISAGEWDDIVAKASKLLESHFNRALGYSYDIAEGLLLTQVPKPRSISAECWQQLQKKAHETTINLFERNIKSFGEGLKVLQSKKPESLSDDEWRRIREVAAREYRWQIERKFRMQKHPLIALSECDLSVLSEEESNKLHSMALTEHMINILSSGVQGVRAFVEAGKPEWLPDKNFDELVKHDQDNKAREELQANLQHSLEEDRAFYQQRTNDYTAYIDVWRTFFVTGSVPSLPPEGFPEADWVQLKMIDNQMKIVRVLMQHSAEAVKLQETQIDLQESAPQLPA